MGIKNRISKIVKLTVFMLLAVVISASFMQIAFAKKVIKSVPSHAENYKTPRYITYEEYINDPFLLCTAHGVAIPGYNSTLVTSGGHTTDTTDQGIPTGKLTAEDLGKATVFSGHGYTDLVPTTSRTYGYYTDAEVHQATPAEAYILAELDQNTPGNGVEFKVTDREYTGDVYEDAYLDVDGKRYYAVEYNSAHEPTKYVAKVNGKYYEVETNDTEGSGSYSAVQIAWWAVATVQEGSRVPDNSLATEARNFEEYINMLSPNGKFEIIRDGEVETTEVSSISLNKTNVTLDPGKTEQLELTMLPDNLAKTDITWTTSNKDVVGIDSKGKITAKKAGTATITVAVKNNESMKAECKVTVTGKTEENKGDKENKKQLRDENKDLNILYLGTEDKTTNQLGNSLVGFIKDYGYSGKFKRVSTNGDLTDLIGSDNWNKLDLASYDVIVIQENENTIRTNGEEFRNAAKKIADSAKSKNSNVKLFVRQVSANKDADSNAKNSIYNTVSEAAKDIGGTVINDGKAFDESSSKNSNINLYSGNENMSDDGTYLSAACIFATVYGHNPEDVDYYGNVGESNGKKLQKIAASVCSSSIKEDDSNKEESEETTEEGENPESVDGVYEGSVSAENLFNIDYPTSMESENAEVLYDSTTNKYKIGPFKVSYLRYITKCGERPAADFSGITESLLTGKFYRDGKEVTELISTDNYRFVYEHDHAAVREANNNVDTDASYPFPYSDEEFYIELDYLDDLASITSFKFNFHYMNGGATFTVYHGTYLTIQWSVHTTYLSSGTSASAFNKDDKIMLSKYIRDGIDTTLKKVEENSGAVSIDYSFNPGGLTPGYVNSYTSKGTSDNTDPDYFIITYDYSIAGATLTSFGCGSDVEGVSIDYNEGVVTIKIPRDYSRLYVEGDLVVIFNVETEVDNGDGTTSTEITPRSQNISYSYDNVENFAWDLVHKHEPMAEPISSNTKLEAASYDDHMGLDVDRLGFLGTDGGTKVRLYYNVPFEDTKIEISHERGDQPKAINGEEVVVDRSGHYGVQIKATSNSNPNVYFIVYIPLMLKDLYAETSDISISGSSTAQVEFYNANGEPGNDVALNGIIEKIKGLIVEQQYVVGRDPDNASTEFTSYIKSVGLNSDNTAVVFTGNEMQEMDVMAMLLFSFKDDSDEGLVEVNITFTGTANSNVSGDGDQPENTEGETAGESDNPNGQNDTSSGTVVDQQLMPTSATKSKSQTQTTVGPGGGDPGGSGGDSDEEDTEMGTGAAYLVDYDADIEFLPDGMEIDLTTSIGGMVWEDAEPFVKGEESKADGIFNEADGDKKLSKIEVRIWKVVYEKKDSTYEEVTSGEYVRTLADAYRKKTVSENGSVKLEDKIDFESDDRSKRLYTDDNGDYTAYLNVPAIQGLDTEKYKVSYDVEFIYDGQTYEVTEYLASTGETETAKKVEKFESTSATPDGAGENPNPVDYSAYANDSYAIETYDERYAYDTKFTEVYGKEEIKSDGTTKGAASNPDAENSEELELNYTSSDKGFDEIPSEETNVENNVDTNNETNNAQTRKESTLVTKDNEGYIYDQYGMKARTSTAGLLLPYEDRIHVEDKKEDIPLEYIDTGAVGQFTYYKPINEYFSHINLGLVNRDHSDVTVSQDLYKAGITVNQDDLTYKYSALIDLEDEKYADKLNMLLDMQNSGVAYEIGLYASDFYYRSDVYKADYQTEVIKDVIDQAKQESELRLFATYKISVYNDSDNQDVSINKLNDYFDSTYTLITEEVKTKIEDENGVREEQVVAEPSYFRIYNPLGTNLEESPYHYNMKEDLEAGLTRVNRTEEESEKMVTGQVTWTIDESENGLREVKGTDEAPGGEYRKMTTETFKTTTADGGKRVTNELTLRPGEKLEIFVSFEVDRQGYNEATTEEYEESKEEKDKTRADLLGGKNNVAEVANYTTFYTEESLGKNNNVAYKAGEVSGKVDKDSAADNVNFEMTEVVENNGAKYTVLDKKWLEDDTETAPVFRVFIRDKDTSKRSINGIVWDEELSEKVDGVENTSTGDGKYTEGEKGIPGVTVTLVEKIKISEEEATLEDGRNIPAGEYEYVWPDGAFSDAIPGYTSVTMSDKDGKYQLENFVSGNYVVRFEYGNTALTMDYNGQDYKNTSYQEGIVNPSQDTIDENFKEEHKNNDQTTPELLEQMTLNNEWHDLTGVTEGLTNSENEQRVSDARDYEARRLGIIGFTRTINNSTAEILAVADSQELKDLKQAILNEMNKESDAAKTYQEALEKVKNSDERLKAFVESDEYKALIEYTSMEANTSKLRVQIEDSSDLDFGVTKKSTGGAFTVNVGGTYDQILDAMKNDPENVKKEHTINNIDFGLERRPDTIIQLDKYLQRIELQKENEPIFRLVLNRSGEIQTEQSIGNESLLSLEESEGTQGFRYINMEEDYLRNTRIFVDYEIAVTNKSEVDYASSKLVNETYTDEKLDEYIDTINDNSVSGEGIRYGEYAGLFYYTHDKNAINEDYTVAGGAYRDDAVRTTVDYVVDYIDPSINLAEGLSNWESAGNDGEAGKRFESLEGLISDDSYTEQKPENDQSDNTETKYYLQDNDGNLYMSESRANLAITTNDGLDRNMKTTPQLERGSKGEGKLRYEVSTGNDKVNDMGQKAYSNEQVIVENILSYKNNTYEPTTHNKDLTKELSTINLGDEKADDKPTSGSVVVNTTADVTNDLSMDDMIYDNLAEVLVYSNSVGRRTMAAIPGNAFEIVKQNVNDSSLQSAGGGIWNAGHSSNPAKDEKILEDLIAEYSKPIEYTQTAKYAFNTKEALKESNPEETGKYIAELDADAAEYVTFTEPTGLSKTMQNQTVFIIAMLIALIVLAVGIIVITLRVVMVKSTDDVTIESTKE